PLCFFWVMNSCLQTKNTSIEFAYLVCEFRRCFFHVPLFGFTSYIADFIEKDGQYYTGMNNYIHNEFSEGHQYHVVEFQLSAKPEEITSSEYKITTSEEYIFTTGKNKYREKVKNRLYKIKILDNKIQISSMLDKGDTTGPKPIE
ncbi:hypothetical protein P6U20_26320, partial [Bacillus paranthracis]|nr:hypothetical protein [Bacillus paranthracis]